MAREMLINMIAGKECRIAIIENGKLEELHIERASSAQHVANIYKGRVTNVESAIQAAFIDFGLPKNGFLHISDVHPKYFPQGYKSSVERVGRKRPHHERPPIQQCLHRGQDIVVQMTKEGIGTKGPTMTTYLSIPGRLLVMMPYMSRLGVSRKVEDPEIREKSRDLLSELKLPPDMGFILRTAGVGKPKRELQRDLMYLTRLWATVKKRAEESKAPAELYQESDLVIRTIRDVYDFDIKRILCDDISVARKVREFLNVAMPRTKHSIEMYQGQGGLFYDFGLEKELEQIYDRHVPLPSGGSLVIDQTEALVAIDVNSGRFRQHNDAETTALKVNQEAAAEISRQLRLRDMGGVIIIDFIDMRDPKNRQAVERVLRNAMKNDRAKTKILKISPLGIAEMTRQRIRPSLKDSISRRCEHCQGSGLIKSEESQALFVLRSLQRAVSNEDVARVEVTVTPSVAQHLANYQRKEISTLEAATGKTIFLYADANLTGDDMTVRCTNARSSEVAWERGQLPKSKTQQISTLSIDEYEKLTPDQEVQQGKSETAKPPAAETTPGKTSKRSRRGGRKHKKRTETTAETAAETAAPAETPAEQPSEKPSEKPESQIAEPTPVATEQAAEPEAEKKAKKSRRRGKRGGRKHRKRTETTAETAETAAPAETPAEQPSQKPESQIAEPTPAETLAEQPSEKPESQIAEPTPAATEQAAEPEAEKNAKKSRRRGKRGGRKHRKRTETAAPAETPAEQPSQKPESQIAEPTPAATEQAAEPEAEKKAKKTRRRTRRKTPAKTAETSEQ